MGYLIDTHVCIWLLSDKNMLSAKVTTILEDESQRIFVSPISFFEIAIKLKIGKLPNFNITLPQFIKSVYDTGI
jgi:PIN domain nuclease of toxin-antitoxin system